MNDKELQKKSINLLKKIQELIEDQHPNVQTEALWRLLSAIIVVNNRDYESCEKTLDKLVIKSKNLMKNALEEGEL